jgi:5-aminopentanamidase
MSRPVKVAVAQSPVSLGDVVENLATCEWLMRSAAARGAELLILPECALTGYVFTDFASVRQASLHVDGPEVRRLIKLCADLDLHLIVGTLEDGEDGVYNSALVLSSAGLIHCYRKVHLPPLGADRFVRAGSEPPSVVELVGLRVGLSICYDIRFPEWARCLALDAADLIANPTNWPSGAEVVARHFPATRAVENGVFVAVANREDTEGEITFIGQSQIVDPLGQILTATPDHTHLLLAEVDPRLSRSRALATSGGYTLDMFADRRPHLYAAVSKPVSKPVKPVSKPIATPCAGVSQEDT